MNYLEHLKSPKATSSITSHLPDLSLAGQFYSDRRLKKDIKPLCTTESGIRLYSYRYTWSNDFTYVGVLAQDLLLSPLYREAVSLESNGFYAVDYNRLGMRMITLSEWRESHDSIFIKTDNKACVAA